MNLLKNVLDSVLLKKQIYVKIKGNLALLKWNEIVGEKLTNYTTPLFYKENKLFIGVISPLFMRELTLMKGDILRKINKSITDSPVKDIKFKLVSQVRKKGKKVGKKDEYIFYDNIKLTAEDINWVNLIADKLKVNDALKEKYRELLIFYKKNERLKERIGYKQCIRCGALFKGEGSLCPICKLKEQNSISKGI